MKETTIALQPTERKLIRASLPHGMLDPGRGQKLSPEAVQAFLLCGLYIEDITERWQQVFVVKPRGIEVYVRAEDSALLNPVTYLVLGMFELGAVAPKPPKPVTLYRKLFPAAMLRVPFVPAAYSGGYRPLQQVYNTAAALGVSLTRQAPLTQQSRGVSFLY